MSESLHDYDSAEALDSAEAIEVFMADALETCDADYVAKAEAVAERARRLLAVCDQASMVGGESRAAEIVARVRQGQEPLCSSASVRKALGLDD
ncbi:hypothetical protein D3C78_758220 [compost metagenome]